MFEVRADKSKNLLTLVFSGHVSPAEAKAAEEKVKALLEELQPGFRLFSDWSGLAQMDMACAPHIEKAMDFCNNAGISKVIRVVPHPKKDIGLNIMSLFHYRRKIQIVSCDTVAEAEKVLAE